MPASRLLLLLAGLALACGRGDLESPDAGTRARAVRALGSARGDSTLTALLVATRDGSPLVRAAAADAFAARGGPGDADALGTLLADPVAAVAEAAARGLAAMPGEPRARQHLVAGYGDASPAARAAIAEALGRLGVSLREAVEAEAQALWRRNLTALESATGAARAGAAEELGASGRAEAVRRLVPLVDPNRNPDPILAAAAARGLGESGDWTARPHLEALLGEADPLLAETSAAALGRLGDPAAADALSGSALRGSDRVALAAVEALAMLPDAPAVGLALCELVLRSPAPVLAGRAAAALRGRDAECPERAVLARLGRPGVPGALAALGELALSREAADAAAARIAPLLEPGRAPDPLLRIAAARTLGRLGGTAAATAVGKRVAAVAAAVTDRRARRATPERPGEPEEQVEELAGLLAAAGRLQLPGAEAALLAWARDPAPAVRAGVAEGLGPLGTDASLEALAGALEDPAAAVRLAAADALAVAGGQGAPALARAATRGVTADAEWADALALALGRTTAAEGVPALAILLEGGAPAAAAALARLGAPAAAEPLVAHLGRPGAPGRAEAIEALAQLAHRDSAPAIAALLTDDRAELRATAARALGRLRHEPAGERLEALRSDYHGRVRRAAVEALAKLPAGGGPRARR